MDAPEPLRVIVVEDDAALLRSVSSVLGRDPSQARVVLASDSTEGALRAIEAGLELDVALVDLRLPDGSGLRVIERLREVRPGAVSVAFTVFDDRSTVLSALRVGARGYLLKHTHPSQLVGLLRAAYEGGVPLSPQVARWLLDEFAKAGPPAPMTTLYVPSAPTRDAAGARTGATLTPREREVLERLCEGATYLEVAAALGVSLSTVQTHVRSIYARLEVRSKAELTALAHRQGLVKPSKG